ILQCNIQRNITMTRRGEKQPPLRIDWSCKEHHRVMTHYTVTAVLITKILFPPHPEIRY
ncbi:mCG145017, partial [Mus musculus]